VKFHRVELAFCSAIKSVAAAWGMSPGSILSRNRTSRVAEARFALYALLYERGLTMKSIGERVGRRGHDTISHGVRRCAELVGLCPEYKRKVEAARAAFPKGTR
jgi:chromosomal replication initiation ATPase DnaA